MKSFKNMVVLGAIGLFGLSAGACYASANDIVVIATVKVKAGAQAAFKSAAEEFVGPSRKEPENMSYQFVQSPSDPTEFATIEHWKSQAGIDAHMKSPHMSKFFGKVGPLFEQGYPQIRSYVEFAK